MEQRCGGLRPLRVLVSGDRCDGVDEPRNNLQLRREIGYTPNSARSSPDEQSDAPKFAIRCVFNVNITPRTG